MLDGSCFKQHRDAFVQIFHDSGIKNGIVVYQSGRLLKEPFSESELKFTQEALFFWLSGWSSPDSYIAIDIAINQTTLFIPKYEDKYQIWTGPIPTTDSIIQRTGVDCVKTIDESDQYFIDKELLYKENFRNYTANNNEFLVAAGKARRIKFPHEVDALRKASEYTGRTLIEVMKNMNSPIPVTSESDIEAMFAFYGARLFGCKTVSFQTIAAAGQNTVYLHYSLCEGKVKDGDLVLLDCGLFYEHYAGDITRTFPANGKFSPEQRLVYTKLLEQQLKLIDFVKPGVKFHAINKLMEECVFKVCQQIGIVSEETPFSKDIAKLFVPHGCSHHIGCNVHDQVFFNLEEGSPIKDSYDAAFTLVPNMIISIEPGIYFHAVKLKEVKSNPEFAKVNFERAFQLAKEVGGIRIEDDVLVTENGCEVLSAVCPKTVEEIEKIMAK